MKSRAIADVSAGIILATVDIAVPPERVFAAISSEEITRWWGSADLYRTTHFQGDLRPGGRWTSSGVGQGGDAFTVSGEYLEVDPPRKLVMTWSPGWDPGPPTTITYRLDPIATGTRLTMHHSGFAGRAQSCAGHADGWERVLGWLSAHLEPGQADRYFYTRLIPPRPSFPADISVAEAAVMKEHAAYWRGLLAEGKAILFGPVAAGQGAFGLGVLRVKDEAELRGLLEKDPARLSNLGFGQDFAPMLSAVHR